MSNALAHELAAMLDPKAGIGWSACSDDADLWEEERSAVARAIPKRRAEFAAGRRAARIALEALGHSPMALPVGDGRAPIWPKGIRGAITHDRGLALAAVQSGAEIFGIGIDLTKAEPLPRETRKTILPHSAEAALGPLAGRVVFSAKECLFKALYPSVKTHFGFSTAQVWPDLHAGTFRIRLVEQVGGFKAGMEWQGRLAIMSTYVLTAIEVN